MCVSELQVKDIVHQEMKPLRDKIDSARNWAVGLLLGLLMTMFGMGVWVGTIDNRVGTNSINQDKFESRVDNKLNTIESLLLELVKEVSRNNN